MRGVSGSGVFVLEGDHVIDVESDADALNRWSKAGSCSRRLYGSGLFEGYKAAYCFSMFAKP